MIEAFVLDPLAEGLAQRPAFTWAGGTMTFDDLAAGVARTAVALRTEGVAPGERVLIALPDSPQLVLSFLGSIAAGAVAVPVNPALSGDALAELLCDSGAVAAIAQSPALEALCGLPAGVVPSLRMVMGAGRCTTGEGEGLPAGSPSGHEGASGHMPGTRAAGTGWAPRAREPRHLVLGPSKDHFPTGAAAAFLKGEWLQPARPETIAFWLYTSGSTGRPKAALHAHRDAPFVADTYFGNRLGLELDDLVYSSAKCFFAYGLGNTMLGPLGRRCCSALVSERSSVEVLLASLARFKPTVLCSVPTLFARVLDAVAEGPLPGAERVRRVTSAGEPLPGPIFSAWRERYGLEILDGIGSTEALHIFISNPPGAAIPGCMGSVVEGYLARVVDDRDQEIGEAAVGRLQLQGGSLMPGYWNRPEADAAVLCGDWMSTGDLVTRNDRGLFFYQGRADEMFKVKGQWVVPLVVESALLALPQVAEAAVVPGHDKAGLLTVRAFVVLRPGIDPTPDLARSIADQASASLPRHAAITEIRYLAQLPRTPTGKVQRFKLRC